MAFQIKDFASITASTINWMRSVTKRVTDFNVGSVVRTMLEAVAAEIEELYQQMFIGLREAIPVSVYNSFNFGRLDAVPASGLVRVSVSLSATNIAIAAGSKFTPNVGTAVFLATQDSVIPAGSTFVDVPVSATVAGTIGNIPAGVGFVIAPLPGNFVSAINSRPFINGLGTETDEQRKLRFNEFIASLNRGTLRAITYGLTEFAKLYDAAGHLIEQVEHVALIEPWLTDPSQPVGLVECYVHNGIGSTSGDLLSKCSAVIYGYTDAGGNKIPGWKAAGVKVNVHAATESILNVSGTITALAGFYRPDLAAAATTAVTQYLLNLDIGESAIHAEIVRLVKSVPGVYNFVPILPVGDTVPASTVKIMPGIVAFDSNALTPAAGAVAIGGNLVTRTP